MKILLVEDDVKLARFVIEYLKRNRFTVDWVTNGSEVMKKTQTNQYDIVLLDIMLPGKSGFEVCRELREKEKDVPIIMLTSRSGKDDIIAGLDCWADDYLVKPFDYDVLAARLDALTRRNLKNKSTSELHIWEYTLDLEKIEVRNAWNEDVHLSDLEFRLLKYFAQNKARAIERQELYEKVWGEFDGDFMFSKTVDVYIWYLRKKLWRDIIETKKWHWYIAN